MLKVNNKGAIRNLAKKSFQASQTRNRIAVAAIALTTVLFTVLFTMGIGVVESFQNGTMRQVGSSAHGSIKYINQEQYDKISKHPLIEEIANNILCANEVTNPEFLKRRVELWYNDENALEWSFHQPTYGRAPETDDEIMMDTVSLELLGIPKEIGAKVTLSLSVRPGDAPIDRTFVLCGWTEPEDTMNVGFGIVSRAYVVVHQEELRYTYPEDSAMTGTIRADIKFQNSANIDRKLKQVIEESGYSTEEGAENYIASNANWAYMSSSVGNSMGSILGIAAGFLLIILTGYLIIYNIFQISVIRDIRFYGLLKTIGTTGKQIKSIIRYQALMLSAMGIPIGFIIGYLVGKTLVPMILQQSYYSGMEVATSLNPAIIVGSGLFSIITVILSTRKPAKIASKVSPVEAVRWADNSLKQGKSLKKSTDGGKISRMALSNLNRNRKRTVLVIVSLSLSLILLNSVFTISRSFDMDKYLSVFVDTDFLLADARYFNFKYAALDGEDSVTESIIQQVEQLEGYQEGGRLYCSLTDFVEDYDTSKDQKATGRQSYATNEEGQPYTVIYGLDDLPFSRLEVWRGEKDLGRLFEKLQTGKYIIEGVSVDDYQRVYEEQVKHEIGDKVTLIDQAGQRREYEILAQIKMKYYTNTCRIGYKFNYYLPSSVYKEIAPEELLMSYVFNVEEGKEAETEAYLEEYTSAIEPLMSYESKMMKEREFEEMQSLFLTVGGILTFIIGLIGILNFINSILTSIVTRRREFAMLESIGMTAKQLKKLLILEGLYYNLGTIVLSFIISILFSAGVIRVLIGQMWFLSYQFTLSSLFMVYPFLILIGIMIPLMIYRFVSNQSIIERLREAE